MRRLMAVALMLLLGLCLPRTAAAQDRAYLLHGGIGYARMLEDGAPDGSIGGMIGCTYLLAYDVRWGFGVEAGYFGLGEEDSGWVRAEYSVIPVLAKVCFLSRPEGPTPVLSAGFGVYPVKIHVDVSSPLPFYDYGWSEDRTETDLGLHAGLGYLFGQPYSRVRLGLEGRFHLILNSESSDKLITAMVQLYH